VVLKISFRFQEKPAHFGISSSQPPDKQKVGDKEILEIIKQFSFHLLATIPSIRQVLFYPYVFTNNSWNSPPAHDARIYRMGKKLGGKNFQSPSKFWLANGCCDRFADFAGM
jgi:hypothetical protein